LSKAKVNCGSVGEIVITCVVPSLIRSVPVKGSVVALIEEIVIG
jgi:hypothetical protein